ncbi:MAG: hypothetical protein JO316_11920 [Abitibacteriaceae bacterium]|nr:hypothetical protein [Abditibacteriaceae bacterium]
MQDFQHDYQQSDSDEMETMQPAKQNLPADSPSSETDAGLDDDTIDQLGGEPVAGANVLEIADDIREIPMTDLADANMGAGLQSGELSDLNAPGEVDIEELDEDALSDTDIPPDALLDPIEE